MAQNRRIAAIIDLETTGLSPVRDEIIEIGIVLFQFSPTMEVIEPIHNYQAVRQPSCRISPYAQAVHGITDQELHGKEFKRKEIELILSQGDLMISHNARFDYGFIVRMFPCLSDCRWYCSMSGIPWRQKGISSRSLSRLCKHYGITVRSSHRALADALLTLNLLSVVGDQGVTHLHELLNNRPYKFGTSKERHHDGEKDRRAQ